MTPEITQHPMQRCGARTRSGTPCQNWPVRGRRRCRLHGGMSTGPKTLEGRARVSAANYRHGRRTKEAEENRRRWRKLHKAIRHLGDGAPNFQEINRLLEEVEGLTTTAHPSNSGATTEGNEKWISA